MPVCPFERENGFLLVFLLYARLPHFKLFHGFRESHNHVPSVVNICVRFDAQTADEAVIESMVYVEDSFVEKEHVANQERKQERNQNETHVSCRLTVEKKFK